MPIGESVPAAANLAPAGPPRGPMGPPPMPGGAPMGGPPTLSGLGAGGGGGLSQVVFALKRQVQSLAAAIPAAAAEVGQIDQLLDAVMLKAIPGGGGPPGGGGSSNMMNRPVDPMGI